MRAASFALAPLRLIFPASRFASLSAFASLAHIVSPPSPQKGHPCKPSTSSGPLCGSRSHPARSTATLTPFTRRSRDRLSGPRLRAAVLLFFLSLLSVSATAQDEPPRLRTIFKNGSILLVENLPSAKYVSVQLFASDKHLPDTPETHGYRHLLEHLCLKGPNHDLDLLMEKQGIFFLGRTLRDAMQIEFTCNPSQIPVALDALKQILQPLNVTQQEIAAETKIMRQEFALETDAQKLAKAAWTEAYGDEGLDPFGDIAAMEKATPASLQEYQAKLFEPDDLVLVISGPLGVEGMTKLASPFLEERDERRGDAGTLKRPVESGAKAPQSKGNENGVFERADGVPGRVEINDAFGEARAARVPGWKDAKTAWALAAALAVASQLASPFVTYTPSGNKGLIILGHTDDTSGVGLKIDALQEGDVAGLFPIGKVLARRWLLRQLEQPSSSAFLRGILMTQSPSNKPDDLLSAIETMTWRDFFRGMVLFREANADVVVGTR